MMPYMFYLMPISAAAFGGRKGRGRVESQVGEDRASQGEEGGSGGGPAGGLGSGLVANTHTHTFM